MAGISDKIKFEYSILRKELSNEIILQKNNKLLADIEGKLKIHIGEILFFEDEYLLLLEFAVDLQKWLNNINNGNYEDFTYTTMDYDEGPILEFKKTNKKSWYINSVWSSLQNGLEVELNQLIESAKLFLIEIDKDLFELYNFHIFEFI